VVFQINITYLQIIYAILKNPHDRTRMSLLFANQTEDDILLRDELEELAASHSDRFRVWYTLDRPPAAWTFSSGFISDLMLKQHMPPPGPATAILVCGPPPMVNFAVNPNLDKLAYPTDCRLIF
jgi:cytochrome-b5 reductase